MAGNKAYEYKTINSRGATIHLIRFAGDEHWKFHNWDGPAIKPHSSNSEFFTEYYLYGMRYRTEEAHNEMCQQREGLPWYKNQSMKHLLSDYRN